jgi:hypothetical protein
MWWNGASPNNTNLHNERPYLMRLSKADLAGRVNSDLRLRFQANALTSFAGLELIRRYFRSIDLAGRLRRHLRMSELKGDYGVVSMALLVLGLLICGGRRLQHLIYLRDDPMVLRLAGLKRLPTPRTLGRWLRRFRLEHVERLLRVNDELVADAIRQTGLRRLTLDVDGTTVSTGLKVQWAFRGFNPHHRKVPSYYPVTAYEAQTGQIFRVRNRPGNVHDGKASLGFLREVLAQVHRTLGSRYLLEFRMDGAFFREDVLRYLEHQRAEYAIKIPFYTWIGLKGIIQSRRRWKRVNGQVSCFSKVIYLKPWDREIQVVVYRKRVFHRSRKNFQLDLFDPADGYFEYSAIATNKTLNGKNLWAFLNGRGTHEKAYGELKNGFAFDSIPTHHYGANSAWQALSVMAHNLIKSFQVATTAVRRPATRKRRAHYTLEAIQTLRYKWINRAGVLVHPDGYPTLDVGSSPEVKNHFTELDTKLQKAA